MAVAKPIFADKLAPGQRLGPFVLLAPLGSGGSGRVWAAVRMGQLGFTKRMALKVMRQDRLGSTSARQRFDREAFLGAQLRHVNLRAVHELGSHDGRPYMAMAWVDASLTELLENARDNRLDASLVCWLGIQACAALAAAHRHVDHAGEPSPVVHGDVSPGNILLTKNGHVQLADLAADAELGLRGQNGERKGKHFFGNICYASPEALKSLPLDGRADLFSLGCVLYEALCGCPAFEADDERSVMFQILEQPPIGVRERNPNVPEDVARVVRRAMERRAEDRFQTAEEMHAALTHCVEGFGAFDLEEATTRLIEDALGERIRMREEEMRLAYVRFSAPGLEKTDTLPIGNAARRSDGETLRDVAGPAQTTAGARDAASSGVEVRQRSRRRIVGASLLGLSIFAGLGLVLKLREPELSETRLPSEPAAPPSVAREAGAVATVVAPAPTVKTTEPTAEARPDPVPPAPLPKKPTPPRGPKLPKKKPETAARPAAGDPGASTPVFKYFRPYPDGDAPLGKEEPSSAPDVARKAADESGASPGAQPSKTRGESD